MRVYIQITSYKAIQILDVIGTKILQHQILQECNIKSVAEYKISDVEAYDFLQNHIHECALRYIKNKSSFAAK